jgi:hypothetical protein
VAWRVVIAGGGFGGFYAASTLARALPRHSAEGRRAARNVAAALGRGRRSPFRYRTLGVFVDMGNREAVASTLGVRWRGLPACTYHLALMPGLHRRAQLLTDWNVGLVFGRDTAELGQLGHPPALDGSATVYRPGCRPSRAATTRTSASRPGTRARRRARGLSSLRDDDPGRAGEG